MMTSMVPKALIRFSPHAVRKSNWKKITIEHVYDLIQILDSVKIRFRLR